MKEGSPRKILGYTRRDFLAAFFGGAVSLATILRHAPEELPKIEQRKKEGFKRLAVIYDRDLGSTARPAASAGAAVVGGIAAKNILEEAENTGLELHDPVRRHVLVKIKDRLLTLFGLGLAISGSSYASELRGENRAFKELSDDLDRAGYHVLLANDERKFYYALSRASEKRPDNAKTIVMINAHGGYIDGNQTISGEKEPVDVEWMAHQIMQIPGHTLVASKSCHISARPFTDYRQERVGKTTLFTANNADVTKVTHLAQPLFRAMQAAMRQPGDLVSNTQAAFPKFKLSLVSRISAWIFGSGFKAVKISHDEPFKL